MQLTINYKNDLNFVVSKLRSSLISKFSIISKIKYYKTLHDVMFKFVNNVHNYTCC